MQFDLYTIGLITIILGGAITGYLCGSVIFAVIISKHFNKSKNIYKHGSGNPGFTNSWRVYGKKIALLVLMLDVLKSVLPTIIFFLIYFFIFKNEFKIHITSKFNPSIFIYTPSFFAIIGHIFPIFFKFKGGKGVACLGGLYLCISPFITIIGVLIIVTVLKIKKIMSIGVIISAFILPFLIFIPGISYFYLIYPNIIDSINININHPIIFLPIFCILALLSLIILIKHKHNITKLINKTENKM